MTATMPFGKYRGRPLSAVPDSYLQWLASDCALSAWLESAVRAELRRRDSRCVGPEVVAVAVELVAAGRRALARKYHPDLGGQHDAMVRTNQAADWLRQVVEGGGGYYGGTANC